MKEFIKTYVEKNFERIHPELIHYLKRLIGDQFLYGLKFVQKKQNDSVIKKRYSFYEFKEVADFYDENYTNFLEANTIYEYIVDRLLKKATIELAEELIEIKGEEYFFGSIQKKNSLTLKSMIAEYIKNETNIKERVKKITDEIGLKNFQEVLQEIFNEDEELKRKWTKVRIRRILGEK